MAYDSLGRLMGVKKVQGGVLVKPLGGTCHAPPYEITTVENSLENSKIEKNEDGIPAVDGKQSMTGT